jgi:hypothetical protein
MKSSTLVLTSIRFAQVFLGRMLVQAQGSINVSNLGETSAGGLAVGLGEALAQPFQTGAASTGYELNSIQLLMGPTDTPVGGFYLSLYSDNNGSPGNNLGNLSGSDNPASSGVYTYTATGIILSPATAYWIVAADQFVINPGCMYWWEISSSVNYTSQNDGWSFPTSPPYGLIFTSSLSQPIEGNGVAPLQFAVNASPVPEPGSCLLIIVWFMVLFSKNRINLFALRLTSAADRQPTRVLPLIRSPWRQSSRG